MFTKRWVIPISATNVLEKIIKYGDKMSEKRNEKQTKRLEGCKHCINYSKEDDTCLLKGLKKCSKKNEFAKCNDYLLHTKYTMF